MLNFYLLICLCGTKGYTQPTVGTIEQQGNLGVLTTTILKF